MMNYEAMGANIRRYRNRAGLRQDDIAEMCECSTSHIAALENGRNVPSLALLVSIANALNVTVDQLLIDSIDNTEIIYLRDMEMRIKKLPTSTKITACDELSNLLTIIERLHEK